MNQYVQASVEIAVLVCITVLTALGRIPSDATVSIVGSLTAWRVASGAISTKKGS